MFKIVLAAMLAAVTLWGADTDKIEIMAQNLSSTETTVTASGNVVVHYGESVIQSETAHYDKEKNTLTLSGKNTELLGFKGSKIRSDEIEINTKSKKLTFKKVFLSDSNDIWIFSDRAIREDGNISFGPTMMSSCDPKRRDWTFYSKSAHYDSSAHYMTMRDVKVKFWDVPVLYTPYFGYSTHRERSSGLLFPSFGYSKTDGFIYEQPLYWAPSRNWDLELRPQIRTIRGYGGYGTLRFADSAYSAGAIRMGFFKDNEEYMTENNIKNDTHYGFEVLYDTSSVLKRFFSVKDDTLVDGLYVNTTYLNDIDYIYLQKRPMSHFGAVPLQESRVNYFVHNEDFSAGLYGKYFIDTRLEDNNSTMQILPTIQLHKYLKPILLDHLTYNLDLTMNNYTRKEGTTLKVAEFYAPIEYTHAFFDDFMTLSLKEDLYYNKLLFGNGTFANDDYQYENAISRVKLFSDLTKDYGSFIHVMQPSLSYSLPGNPVESPVDFDQLDEDQKRLFAPGREAKTVALKFSQYFYDDSGDMKFYERLTQKYLPDEEESKLGNLYHEMKYNLDEWEFYNYFVYTHEFNKILEVSSSVRWKVDDYSIAIEHSFERSYAYDDAHEIEETKENNGINLKLSLKVTNRIGFDGGVVYDIDNKESSQYRFGLSYNRDCWNLALGLRQDIRPLASNDGSDSILENTFTFQLNFVPFGGVGISNDDIDKYTGK